MLIDAHCHLQDKRIAHHLPMALERAACAGVEKQVCCGTSESDWQEVLKLAQSYATVHPCLGLHPWYVTARSRQWLVLLEELLIQHPMAGLGEIGLDHAIQDVDRNDQDLVFREQLALARTLHRPVSIHCRRAWKALLTALDETGPLPDGWMIHSFSGSMEMMQELTRRGAYISLSGSITRQHRQRIRNVAAAIPDHQLLIETDAPDIIPYSIKGDANTCTPINDGPNLPEYLVHIARELAAIRDTNTEALSAITTRNTRRLFG
ncbi:MAG: TatD family hydrolase [Kiritimatiellae bacterium]|nr:TatD family hydrolase [Kiritimatiellia bacterium]